MPRRTSTRLTKTAIEALKPGHFLWDAALPGFGIRATAAGRKSYIVQYRTGAGGQGRISVGAYPALTVEQARTIARSELATVEAGGDPSAERRARRHAPTVDNLADEYLGPYATSRDLRAATITGAKSALRPARARLGRMKVADVSVSDLRRLHGEVLAEQRSRGKRGVYQANRMLGFLSSMFSLAQELGWRNDNPCKLIKKYPEDERWRNCSEDEVYRLQAACDIDQDQEAANAIRLLLFTGARLREVLQATWSQFDLDRGLWERSSAHTKSRKLHRLELEGPSLRLLRSMRSMRPDSTYLFPGKPSKRADSAVVQRGRSDLNGPWRRIRKRARLDDVRLHDLRRTTASFMLSDGASLATVGKVLGHTQASTTARYAHLSLTVAKAALGRAGERMAKLAEK